MSNISIQLPISITQRKKKRKTNKNLITQLYIDKIDCDICKLKKFSTYFIMDNKIPEINMDEFNKKLKNMEKEYIKSNDDCACLSVNLTYLYKLRPFIRKKLNINISIIKKHFDVCIFENPSIQKLRSDRNIDEYIKGKCNDNFLCQTDPVSGIVSLHKDNIKALLDLKRIGSGYIDDHIKLSKIYKT